MHLAREVHGVAHPLARNKETSLGMNQHASLCSLQFQLEKKRKSVYTTSSMASGVKLGDDFRTKRHGGSLISAIRHYVHTAITVPSQEGKVGKVLILDPETVRF